MRGKTWTLVLFLAMMTVGGRAADMSLQFGAMPGWTRQGVTVGAGLLFPRTITEFLTPELTLAYWTVGESAVVYSPMPGEYDPPYFHWGHPYDGPWDAVATGLRLNIENAWPLLPKFFACGVGVSQLAAWKSDDTVHDHTYGVVTGSVFLRVQVPTALRQAVFLEVEAQHRLFGQNDFPDNIGAAKLGYRFGILG